MSSFRDLAADCRNLATHFPKSAPMQTQTTWVYDDGGRAAAGFRGTTGDCVCRAVAIATQRPYIEIYRLINTLSKSERRGKRKRAKKPVISSAREGVYKSTTRKLLAALGWVWVPTMGIGSGCTVHLKASELPGGRIVVSLSKHLVAVVDGVVRDISDPSRCGTRCVYGYWYRHSDGVGGT